MKRLLFSIVSVFVVVFSGLFFNTGCANIIPPSGGPRDSLPPVLVSATPADSTTNFRGNRITLQFDEYIDLQEVQQNLLFTPLFETTPIVEARLRTINIRLRDSLEANTTYTFNFGNAIRDINENNVLRDFAYTFSTGPALDSLTLNGKVLLAETGTPDSTLIVVLHRDLDDSAVAKQRPRYVSRLDRNGAFLFRNLPPGTFAIYAIGDAAISRRYQTKTQFFAFRDAPVNIGDTAAPITLYAYREAEPTGTTTTGGVPAATRPAAADRRLRYTPNNTGNLQNLLDSLVLTFERPLRSLDTAGISFSTDSTFTPVPAFTTRLDTSKTKLSIQTAWVPETRYNLILRQDFAEDTLGRKLAKTDTLTFNTRKLTDYGAITLRVRGVDASRNPVLQFVQNNKVVFAAPIASGVFTQKMFLPGEYEFRILYDTNGNGVWDAGRFFGTKKQPEIAVPLGERKTVKPAWDNEFEIVL